MSPPVLVIMTAAGVMAGSVLAGCGQKGPLMLPDEAPQLETPIDGETRDDEQEEE